MFRLCNSGCPEMLHPREMLRRQLEEFFFNQLLDVQRWDQVQIERPIPVLKVPYHQRPKNEYGRPIEQRIEKFGKFEELVTVKFRGYSLSIWSPSDEPPLGKLALLGNGVAIDGPIVPETWQKIAEVIRATKPEEIISNVSSW